MVYNISLKLDLLFGTDMLSNAINEMLFKTEEELPPCVDFEGEAHEKILNILSEIKYMMLEPKLNSQFSILN